MTKFKIKKIDKSYQTSQGQYHKERMSQMVSLRRLEPLKVDYQDKESLNQLKIIRKGIHSLINSIHNQMIFLQIIIFLNNLKSKKLK